MAAIPLSSTRQAREVFRKVEQAGAVSQAGEPDRTGAYRSCQKANCRAPS